MPNPPDIRRDKSEDERLSDVRREIAAVNTELDGGDTEDFERFYRENSALIRRLCIGYLKAHPSADLDIESVYASCRRRLFTEFRTRGRVGFSDDTMRYHLWQTVMSKGAAKAEFAARRIRTVPLDEEPAVEISHGEHDHSEEKASQLLRALASKTDREIARRRANGEKHVDIAKALGMTPVAIYNRISKIRKILRQAIEERDAE